MADPVSRKNNQVTRMRQRLKKKREALADFFDYKIYIAFIFKDQKKGSALFEASEVVPIMTNNYEDKIMKGADRNIYSYESSQELIGKDVVQFYIPRYASMRKDVLGCAQDVDFFLWPRGDLLCIRCFLFSRWKDAGKKGVDEPFRLVQADFMYFSSEYEMQLRGLLPSPVETPVDSSGEGSVDPDAKSTAGTENGSGIQRDLDQNNVGKAFAKAPGKDECVLLVSIYHGGSILRGGKDLMLNNSNESMFLFVDRLTAPQNPSKSAIFKLQGICLYLPQDALMRWGLGSIDEILRPFMT